MIRGGQNIASKEVEEALYHHPAVMEAAVVGAPSAGWGEDIVAAVMLRPGATATAAQIRDTALASGLTRFKCPARIDFVPELPRNAIGKIQKGLLRSRPAPAPAPATAPPRPRPRPGYRAGRRHLAEPRSSLIVGL